MRKMNSFTDFIDCSEYLIKEKYTSRAKLFALGGSAGGLLMGAVVNMRPDLYKGVIAAVPFVDVVTTMSGCQHSAYHRRVRAVGQPRR